MVRKPHSHSPTVHVSRFAAIGLASLTMSGAAGMSGLVAIILLGLIIMTVVIVVVCPAVWSKSPMRRSAALSVLDLIGRVVRR